MTTGNRFLLTLICLFGVQAFAAEKPQLLEAGDMAPDLVGRDINNNVVRLTSLRDKVVVVSFFASWCEPCRRELPMLEQLQRAGAEKGLQVIAVNWKEDRAVFRALVRANPGYQLKFVSDASGLVGSAYGVKAIPHMFLVGKDGRISFVNIGYGSSVIDRLLPKVNEALNGGATMGSAPTS